MAFTETEKKRKEIDKYLTKKEKKEIEEIIGEIEAIYQFIQKEGLYTEWMHDSERFIGFGFFHTKTLVKHSIVLSRLTRWLIGLTATLLILSFVQIVLYVIERYT